MHHLRTSRPSPALAVALCALLISLGGTSYAVTTLPARSVGAKQLKPNAVTASRIRANAVDGSKLKDNAVDGSKIEDDAVTGADIDEASLARVPSAATSDTSKVAASANT